MSVPPCASRRRLALRDADAGRAQADHATQSLRKGCPLLCGVAAQPGHGGGAVLVVVHDRMSSMASEAVSISKHRAPDVPAFGPKVGAMIANGAMISSHVLGGQQMGTPLMPTSASNRTALPPSQACRPLADVARPRMAGHGDDWPVFRSRLFVLQPGVARSLAHLGHARRLILRRLPGLERNPALAWSCRPGAISRTVDDLGR